MVYSFFYLFKSMLSINVFFFVFWTFDLIRRFVKTLFEFKYDRKKEETKQKSMLKNKLAYLNSKLSQISKL